MTNFTNWKSYKDVSKTTTSYAAKRGLEVLVYNQTNDIGQTENVYVEIWLDDDTQECPVVVYLITDNGLQFYTKHDKYHNANIEDLLYMVRDEKQLRAVVQHIAECLKGSK